MVETYVTDWAFAFGAFMVGTIWVFHFTCIRISYGKKEVGKI